MYHQSTWKRVLPEAEEMLNAALPDGWQARGEQADPVSGSQPDKVHIVFYTDGYDDQGITKVFAAKSDADEHAKMRDSDPEGDGDYWHYVQSYELVRASSLPSSGERDADTQMQHDFAEASEFRVIEWADWELAWTLGCKFGASSQPTSGRQLTDQQIGDIVQRAFTEIDNDPPEAATWAIKLALKEASSKSKWISTDSCNCHLCTQARAATEFKQLATSGRRDGLEQFQELREWAVKQAELFGSAKHAVKDTLFRCIGKAEVLASSTSGSEMLLLNVADVSRVLVERTNGIAWRDAEDGNMARLTDALNELLRTSQTRMQEPSK